MFGKHPKNEKWEDIRRREARNEIIFVLLSLPALYLFLILGFAL